MAKRMPQGMGGGINANMMKQVQKMQQDMLKAQEEIEATEYSAASGGGAVSVTVTGKREVVSITIDKSVVDPDDVEMLGDLVLAAVNEALRKAASAMEEGMGKFTGGLGLPF